MQDSDIELAKELVGQDKMHKKILEMEVLVKSDTLDGRFEGQFRMIWPNVVTCNLECMKFCLKCPTKSYGLMLSHAV